VWELGGRAEALRHLLLLAQQRDVVGRHLGQVRESTRRAQQLRRDIRP